MVTQEGGGYGGSGCEGGRGYGMGVVEGDVEAGCVRVRVFRGARARCEGGRGCGSWEGGWKGDV